MEGSDDQISIITPSKRFQTFCVDSESTHSYDIKKIYDCNLEWNAVKMSNGKNIQAVVNKQKSIGYW